MAFGPVYMCMHCGAQVKGKAKFCPDCSTAPLRKAMDEANQELWQEKFGEDWHCKFCENQKRQREKAKSLQT